MMIRAALTVDQIEAIQRRHREVHIIGTEQNSCSEYCPRPFKSDRGPAWPCETWMLADDLLKLHDSWPQDDSQPAEGAAGGE